MTRATSKWVLPLVVALSLVATACKEATSGEGTTCAVAGQPCTGGTACCSGLTCDATTGACVAPPCVSASESCANGETCCSGIACVNGTCTSGCPAEPIPSPICADGAACCLVNGASCSISAECCSAVCSNGTCTTFDDPAESMCIPVGEVCQFSEQCCGGAPCVADNAGILRCRACKPDGAHCSGASDATCCAGASCVQAGGRGKYVCLATPPPICTGEGCCLDDGASCSTSAQCCSGVCDNGACKMLTCMGTAGSCTVNADCCLGLMCDVPAGAASGTCKPPCVGTGGSCTVSGDCCSGNCDVPAGATSGTCTCSTAT